MMMSKMKIGKKLFSIVLALVLACTSVPVSGLVVKSSVLAADTVSDEVLIINSPEDLIKFGDSVNGGNSYKGETVVLAGNIDMKDKTLTSIGYYTKHFGTQDFSHVFQGTFDGQGYQITNLTFQCNSKGGYQESGLFSFLYGATLKNLTVKMQPMETEWQESIGAIAGRIQNTTIRRVEADVNINMTVNVDKIVSAGGLVGRMNAAKKKTTREAGSATATVLRILR